MLIIIFLQPFCIQGDLAKEEDTIKVVDETIKHYGRLDILVRTHGWKFSGLFLNSGF